MSVDREYLGGDPTTDNDTRAFIYFLEMSDAVREADFLAIVGGKGDYGAAERGGDGAAHRADRCRHVRQGYADTRLSGTR